MWIQPYGVGQVPHTGNLAAVNNGALVLKLVGFEVISDTHHLSNGWLNTLQS